MIKLSAVEYSNFQSVGATPIRIDLNRSNSTLIGGQNGAGKSTLFQAIAYVLYGKLLSSINLDQVVNSTNGKKCLVEIWFEVHGDRYHIQRGMRPGKFNINKNDEKLHEKANSGDMQKKLDIILGMDFKVFTQTILLNNERFVPFMKMSIGERRKIIEDVLGLSIFTQMNQICKERISNFTKDEANFSHERDLNEERLNGKTALVELAEKAIEDAAGNLQDDINRLTGQINESNSAQNVAIKAVEVKYDQSIAELEVLHKEATEAATTKIDKHIEKETENIETNFRNDEAKIDSEIDDKFVEIQGRMDIAADKLASSKSARPEGDIDQLNKEKESATKTAGSLEALRVEHTTKIKMKEEMKTFFEDHEDCPTCKREIDAEVKAEQIKENVASINSLTESLGELDLALDKARTKRFKLIEEINAIEECDRIIEQDSNDFDRCSSEGDKFIANRSTLKGTMISSLTETRDRMLDDLQSSKKAVINNLINSQNQDYKDFERERDSSITTIKEKTTHFNENLEREINILKAKLEAPKNDDLDGLKKEQKELEILGDELTANITEVVANRHKIGKLRDMLSDTGIKSLIVKEYIPIINQKMNEYLNAMNFYMGITLDENFNETFSSLNRGTFTYNSLSSGQKCRVNLALWLAFIEVGAIKNSISCNFLALDEILEPIDAEGIKDVITLFNEKLGDKNVFVITQRFSEFEDLFRSSINFKLNNDFTEMVP